MNIPDAPPPMQPLTPPPMQPLATLRLRIDSAAIAGNWRALNRLSGSAQAAAAVKADAYGVGVDMAVPALFDAGAREFLVAHWSEAAPLLRHAPATSISVLHGISSAEEARFAIATGVRPVLNSLHQAKLWRDAGGRLCNLMVDSGINRLGFEPSQLADPLVQSLSIDVLMSHLASAEDDTPQNAQQLAVFQRASTTVEAQRLSLANSAGIALGEAYHFGLTRPGLALYGGVPCAALAPHISQAVFVHAAVLQMRDLAAGDAVGYNAAWVADRPTRVATISLGYADGLLRCWGQNGALQHEGRDLPILGRVSMDMIVVDCSGCPSVKEGDFLELPYDLSTASQRSGLSQYELLTVLGTRFMKEKHVS